MADVQTSGLITLTFDDALLSQFENGYKLLGEWDVRMTPHKAVGDPTSEIRAAAEESGVGVIVVGRGSGLRRLLDGSVSARLVRRAPCDVLVVH